MIDHGKRFGGEQPEVSRQCHQRGSPHNSFWSDDEDESTCLSRLKQPRPTDLEGWRDLARQAGVENKMLRCRIRDCEKQIFTLQQQVDRETARAAAQAKNQLTMEADLRTARDELLRLRHTIRMNQRGAELTRGAVIGGGAGDCSREVFLLREALAEAAEYHMQLLQQNDSLRVQVEWLRRSDAPEASTRSKDADKTRLDAHLGDHERRELEQLRDLFYRLQSAAEDNAGHLDAVKLGAWAGEEDGGRAGDRSRIHPSAGRRRAGSVSDNACGHSAGVDSSSRVFMERSTSGDTAPLGAVLLSKRGVSEENCSSLPSGSPTGFFKDTDVSPAKSGPDRVPRESVKREDAQEPIKRLDQRIREYQSKAPGATAATGEPSPRLCASRDRCVSDK
ncbi:conserved hypothetical protein [Neospora caninum Liverpool]|nr:conserved hypothetical protein [Neospora caninum Liverpool]CBZ53486.1 conserved hypothetical protein [Neospora caninum Liverpool]|eukprot:XP_003883518.1 conserved hypothetical protein [Neospora caninum Liverpool]